jgi:proteic killer suppression protein
MIRSFADIGGEDLFNGRNLKAARRTLPRELWKRGLNKLSLLDYAADLSDVGNVPGNRLEALKGDRKGQHSIRINDQYRICFRWTDVGPEVVGVVDYH